MADGLSAEELAAVERTWNLVKQDLKGNGTKVFLALFKAFPEYQKLFKRFKDMSYEELKNTPSLRAHGTVFMHGLAAMVDNLDDTETLVRVIEDNTDRHFKRNIRYEHFQNTLSIFPGFLKEQLGSEMDDDATSGWQKVLQVMDNVIKNKLQELESSSQ